jgi:hypothetical protein
MGRARTHLSRADDHTARALSLARLVHRDTLGRAYLNELDLHFADQRRADQPRA